MPRGDNRRGKAKSAITVAQLLGTEGFSDYTASEVRRYALHSIATDRQRFRHAQVKKAFGKMIAEKLDERDRIVMGKFISMLSKMNFDTGLRIGITAFLYGARDLDSLVEGE